MFRTLKVTGHTNSTVYNNSLSRTNSVERRPENYAFPSVVSYRMKTHETTRSLKCQFTKK